MAEPNEVKAGSYTGGGMTVEEYRRQEKALETACKQFEGTMFSKLWKDMMKTARSPMGEEKKRQYGVLEDTVVEMVSEHLSESQGVGVWKVLYDQLHERLSLPEELKIEKAEALAASSEVKSQQNLRPSKQVKNDPNL
jgi:Rod binding domain-containing protein